jgi:hypothetical protein
VKSESGNELVAGGPAGFSCANRRRDENKAMMQIARLMNRNYPFRRPLYEAPVKSRFDQVHLTNTAGEPNLAKTPFFASPYDLVSHSDSHACKGTPMKRPDHPFSILMFIATMACCSLSVRAQLVIQKQNAQRALAGRLMLSMN